jgi:hypothetical protein
MNNSKPVWSVPVDVEDIADTGLHMEIEAPSEVRAALAETAGLRDVKRLKATIDLAKHGERVDVLGRVNATVGQTCVVTLEPIDNEIDEAVDVVFAPMSSGATASPRNGGQRKGDDEPPEPLIDGTIDLGAVASEFLMLGIDPYPRKAGAQFAPPQLADDGPHPFAALEALKKRPGTPKS